MNEQTIPAGGSAGPGGYGGRGGLGDAGASGQHELVLTGRKRLQVAGVTHVASFDDREIVLDTRHGSLTIRGEGLHMTQLDLDNGRFAVTGQVNMLQYGPSLQDREHGRLRGRSIFERLLK